MAFHADFDRAVLRNAYALAGVPAAETGHGSISRRSPRRSRRTPYAQAADAASTTGSPRSASNARCATTPRPTRSRARSCSCACARWPRGRAASASMRWSGRRASRSGWAGAAEGYDRVGHIESHGNAAPHRPPDLPPPRGVGADRGGGDDGRRAAAPLHPAARALAPIATTIGMRTFDRAWDPVHGYLVPAEAHLRRRRDDVLRDRRLDLRARRNLRADRADVRLRRAITRARSRSRPTARFPCCSPAPRWCCR